MLGTVMAVAVVVVYAALALLLYRLLGPAVERRLLHVAAALGIFLIALYLAPGVLIRMAFNTAAYVAYPASGSEPAGWVALLATPLHYAMLACYGIGILWLVLATPEFLRRSRAAATPETATTALSHCLSVPARFGYGIALPLLVLVVVQYLLMATNPHPDSWGGMGIFFTTVVAVPVLLIANTWVLVLRWRRRATAFLAGMALPLTIIVPSILYTFGSKRLSQMIFVYSPWALLYLLPLVAAVIVTRARRARAA